jgi:four helix bundle protein
MDYKKLKVWQKSIDLVVLVYKVTGSFPSEEKYGLVSQIRRSVISIPSNIAEGQGRKSIKMFINFLRVSIGSLSELETQIIVSDKLDMVSDNNLTELNNLIIEIIKMLHSLVKSLSQDNC